MIGTYQMTPSGKLRARAIGLAFSGTPGAHNCITDVPGVTVGYTTLIAGDGALQRGQGPVRTGVTAILPRGRLGVGQACAAGIHSFNGNGELTAAHWIEESGAFNTPILISNTHAVGACHQASIRWIADHHPALAEEWLLPVCAETWDGYLNDINGEHVTVDAAYAALERAHDGAIEEGSVGGGTGMNCYAFKGGSGTASRVVPYGSGQYTVGVFLQANFGSRKELTIQGHRLGEQLAADNPIEDYFDGMVQGAGSCIGIVATDAPLLPGQCKALARRVSSGLARTGTTGSHFSGDIYLAFSTANAGALNSGFAKVPPDPSRNRSLEFVPWPYMDAFYTAVVEATEEAVLNVLVANDSMVGRDGHRSPALPHDAIKRMLASRR